MTARSGPARLVDRVLSAGLKLPKASWDYTVDRDEPQPMRDGVVLLADHYAPVGAPPLGTILVRCPYGRTGVFGLVFARFYAERGYHVVIQSTRGTYGSGGVLDPMSTETEDGADTVSWLREQPWFTGTFATIGASYLGFTQWCLLADPPPELVASVVMVGVHDIFATMHGSGAFSLHLALGWSSSTSTQEDHSGLAGVIASNRRRKEVIAPAFGVLPLLKGGEQAAGRAPWYPEWVARREATDSYWEPRQARAALTRNGVPVLLVAGWQDIFLDQDLEAYGSLKAAGAEVALTVGPWSHVTAASTGIGLITRETLDWLGQHAAGEAGSRTSEVRVHVGGDGWRDYPSWPPPTSPRRFYPAAGGRLDDEAVAGPDVTFTYDPADPTPTVGGQLLDPKAGRRDNTALEARPDVVTFTTDLLAADLDVVGTPVVHLAHASDNPHCDVFVRLCEVSAKGKSVNVCDGFVRLSEPGQSLRLPLQATAHRFKAGSRLRLQISGGSHPRWDRNLGTGADPATSTELRPSRRTITLGADTWLELPIPGPS